MEKLEEKEKPELDRRIESKMIEQFSWFVEDMLLHNLLYGGVEPLYKKQHYLQLYSILHDMRNSRKECNDV